MSPAKALGTLLWTSMTVAIALWLFLPAGSIYVERTSAYAMGIFVAACIFNLTSKGEQI